MNPGFPEFRPCRILATRRIAAVALAVSGLAALPAQAAWMGLADGTYSVDLNCDFSTEIPCPGTITGVLTISGGSATAMDFSIDGEHFTGDPLDAFVDGSLADFEGSFIQILPDYRFLSLRLITDGSIGSYGVGDRWWVYCNNFDIDSCTPNTTGLWTATLISAVPAPATLALAALGLGLLFTPRRASRREATRPASA